MVIKQFHTEKTLTRLITIMKQFLYTLLTMSLAAIVSASDIYSGSWKVTEFVQNELPLVIPESTEIILILQSQDDINYHVSLKIANRFMGGLTILGKTSDNKDIIKMGAMAGTRMMAPPTLQPLERFVSQEFPILKEMFVESDILILQGPTGRMTCHLNTDLSGSS